MQKGRQSLPGLGREWRLQLDARHTASVVRFYKPYIDMGSCLKDGKKWRVTTTKASFSPRVGPEEEPVLKRVLGGELQHLAAEASGKPGC